jgi:hypothetical protein
MAHEREPLLQQRQTGAGNAAALPSLARTVLKFLMWAVFLTWAAGIFLYPTKPVQAVFKKWVGLTRESMFGMAGTVSTRNCALLLLLTPSEIKAG